MKFKLDENIGTRGQDLLRSVGYDVATVRDEQLSGEPDETLFEISAREGRALITLDHDFGQPRATRDTLVQRIRDFLAVLEKQPLENELWIVEPGRVRVHQREE